MTSHQFIETLRRIGYPDADSLDPESLDWAFESASTLPILEWFCESINEDNVIGEEEIDEYRQIQESGNVLSGSDLKVALKAVGKDVLTGDTETGVDQLRETVARAKLRKEALMSRCSKLSVHNMALRDKVGKLEKVEEHEWKAYQKTVDKCTEHNGKVNEALHALLESVQKIMFLYKPPASGEGEDTNAHHHFLSQLDLKAYQEAEEKFSHDLTAFTKKQFSQGIAVIAGDKETEQYDLVDVASPEKLASEGREVDSFLEDCQEFSRLQQIFPRSECNQINALVNAKKALSALHEAKSILHTLKSDQFPTSPAEISRLHHTVEQNIEAAKSEVLPLQASLPELIKELGTLQGTEILTGDYDLKLKRQDYFIKKQDKIIEHLVSQRARNEFLIMLYDLEIRCHKETHHLLSAVRQALETSLQGWQQRMKDLEDPDLSARKFERNVVDSRDASTPRLYELLGHKSEDEKMLYLPKQKVVEKARDFQNKSNALQSANKLEDEKYSRKVPQLEACVRECESCLYEDSSTSSGHPVLSPLEVQSAISSLTSHLSALEGDITAVISDVDNKKMALKNNVLQNKERQLFTLFHTNPERLKYVVNGLADRLKVQDIK